MTALCKEKNKKSELGSRKIATVPELQRKRTHETVRLDGQEKG